MAPSPTRAITGRDGWANLAPIAYGTAHPMVARVPDTDARMPDLSLTQRANQLVDEPESAVTIASSGSRWESSHATRIGLTGLAVSRHCRSRTSHQCATLRSTPDRHDGSAFGRRCGINAPSAALAS